MEVINNNVKIYQTLESFPQLKEHLSRVLHLLSLKDQVVAIGVKGSLMKGTTDRYSDVDLVVFVNNDCSLGDFKREINMEFPAMFSVITNFPATHIGMDNLLVFFLRSGNEVIKIDIEVALLQDVPAKMDFLLLYSRDTNFAERMQPTHSQRQPDFADLHAKFTGWIWYTYTKIKRGELLEAADSINVMRNYTVLPCVLVAEGLPVEGYRFIERRLDPGLLDKLRMCYPVSLTPADLFTVLKRLIDLYKLVQPKLQQQIKDDGYKLENLFLMEELVKKDFIV